MTEERSEPDSGRGSFDQTNGMVDGLDGDSDGTRTSDATSAADRTNEGPLPLKRVGAARDFGIHIKPTDAAGNTTD